MPLEHKPWRMPEEVKSLNVAGKPAHEHNIWSQERIIGHGGFGRVFIGSVRFKGGKRRRVAIKRFKTGLSDSGVAKFRKIIQDLRTAELPVLKTDFVKLKTGEWVQVSELLGSTERGSRLFKSWSTTPYTHERVLKEMEIMIKMANLGYEPVPDMFFRTKDKVYIGDFDNLCPLTAYFCIREIVGFFTREYSGQYLFELDSAIKKYGSKALKREWIHYLSAKK